MKRKSFTNAEIPIDFQIDVFNKEELNDDDCLFYCLLDNIIRHPDFGDTIIRLDNPGLCSTVRNRYSTEFIRKSLGKLEREGMILVQFKAIPSMEMMWREISIKFNEIKPNYFQDWVKKNAVKFELAKPNKINQTEEFVSIENLSLNLRIDINNEDPLSDDDYSVLTILLKVEENSPYKSCGLKNSQLSEISNGRFSETFICQSLGRLEREGIISVTINGIPNTRFHWREITVAFGFFKHQGVRDFISRFQKKSA